MPLIKRRQKDTLKSVTFRIPETLASRLNSYAEYTNVPQTEILVAALSYAIASDKDFAAAGIAGSNTNSAASSNRKKAATL